METLFRAALIAWLASDSALAGLNAVEEESPLSASPPWLGIAASASTDWSTKDRKGREIRVALELLARGDEPDSDVDLVHATEERVKAMPHTHDGFEVISAIFLRARVEQRPDNRRAFLLEYRFRLFEIPTE